MRYVIIGSGVAGMAAVEGIRSVHPSPDRGGDGDAVEIVMIGDDPHGFYSRPGLACYLTGELHNKALSPRTADDYRKMNFREVRRRVANLVRNNNTLEFADKHTLTYDKLLIAVGAQASTGFPKKLVHTTSLLG